MLSQMLSLIGRLPPSRQFSTTLTPTILLPTYTSLLKALRSSESPNHPHHVFPDSSLPILLKVRPTTDKELLTCKGFGKIRTQKYGSRIYDIFNTSSTPMLADGDPLPQGAPYHTTSPSEEEKAFKIATSTSSNTFISGSAGTGKSILISHLLRHYTPKNCSVTSTTALSAKIINGTTLHSHFKYRVVNNHHMWGVGKLKVKDVIIIDEVSMLTVEAFEAIYRLAKEKNSKVKFIVLGDFFQLPPVDSGWVFMSEVWKEAEFELLELEKSVRHEGDPQWSEVLERFRIGNISNSDIDLLNSRLIENNLSTYPSSFPPLQLFPTNSLVSSFNDLALDKINKPSKTYPTYSLPLQTTSQGVTLKPGAKVVLTYNISQSRGLVNGTTGVVEELKSNSVLVKFEHGRDTIKYTDVGKENKIPLELAYARTIHGSQGSTLSSVEVDLNGVFDYGQIYVALSRVRNLKGLWVRKRLPRLEESPQWWNMVCPSVVEFYGLHNKNVREDTEVDNETRATLFLDVPEYYEDSDNKYIEI
ncbi:hypothetical protein TrVE_jg11011 [Triparma verrucosa]|uniref:HRDC domain-containing protein n=1 Tax=Triparma verrucosa TaxID=1606542 RepID=A0A9W7C111_9STRA|nr:hypothetical protein TrVE_jg11011 [Triparma verrucosa]